MSNKIKTKKIIAVALVAVFTFFSLSENSEAKNYRSRVSFSVSGDQTNSDAAISYGGMYDQTYYYRKSAFPKLKMADPFPLRIFHYNDDTSGFGEQSWSTTDHNFITNGYIWTMYGDSIVYEGSPEYYPYLSGDFRAFSYFGGTKKKKRKNSAYKTFEFTPSGAENEVDAIAREDGESTNYYYKKFAVSELDTDNLIDFRLYSRDISGTTTGYTEEHWTPDTYRYFVTDGYLYLTYGYKTTDEGATFQEDASDTYRLFAYSDAKRKKGALKKQYVKKYSFNIPNDPNVADKVTTYTDSDGYISKDYYKKVAVKGLKMTDIPNTQVMRRNNFISGFSDESWSQRDYTITAGYVWINYGYQYFEPDGTPSYDYQDSGSGDYQIFTYR